MAFRDGLDEKMDEFVRGPCRIAGIFTASQTIQGMFGPDSAFMEWARGQRRWGQEARRMK